jgi:xylan 1,4-beta-xylosidase
VNFTEDFDTTASHDVTLTVDGLAPGSWRCGHYRIDRDHSNAYTAWLSMGRPVVPDDEQLSAIQARMGLELMEPERALNVAGGRAELSTTLPAKSVSLWLLDKG